MGKSMVSGFDFPLFNGSRGEDLREARLEEACAARPSLAED
jgi:hypothetical protein